MTKKEAITNLFTYKPPTEQDKEKFDRVKEAVIDFAVDLSAVVTHPAEMTIILRKIQEIRMLANQAICYQSNNISYSDVFFIGEDSN